MPTYLRRFYLQKLTETKENEIKQAENTRKNDTAEMYFLLP